MEDEETFDITACLPSPEKLAKQAKSYKIVLDYTKKNPGKYDSGIIARMKRMGMKKPSWIPSEAWSPPSQMMDARAALIARFSACGMKPAEIAKQLHLEVHTINEILKEPSNKKMVLEIQEQMFGGNPREMFRSAMLEAFNTEIEIMRTPTEKGSTRLNAAQDIMDRAVGKATQEINVNNSGVRSLIDRLDKLERLGGFSAIEVLPEEVSDAQYEEVGDNQVEPSHSQTDVEPLDPVDRWLKESGICPNGSRGNNQ